MAAMIAAASIASSINRAAGTTRETRPERSASCNVHEPTGQAHVHRLGFANGAGQALRAPNRRHDAELDFRLAEFGILGGDDDSQCMASSQPPPSA